jgi:hypothetical protein
LHVRQHQDKDNNLQQVQQQQPRQQVLQEPLQEGPFFSGVALMTWTTPAPAVGDR